MTLVTLVSEHEHHSKTKKKITYSIQSNPGGRLEEWTSIRNTKRRYRKQLCNFLKVSMQWYLTLKQCSPLWHIKTDSIKEHCRPIEMGGGRNWKLGIQEAEDSEIEEVVLRIQGIMCNRDLPPILSPFKV
jgi:hypothetical protein